MKRALLSLVAWMGLSAAAVQAAPNVLSWPHNGDPQCYNGVTPAVTATAGSGAINTSIFLDFDTTITTLAADMSNSSATSIFSIASQLQVNHAPYFVGQYCYQNFGMAVLESGYYSSMIAAGGVFVAPAPIAAMLVNPVQLPSSIMVVTSPNSLDSNKGTGGPGSEFFLSASYLGLTTNSDSADIGALSGIVAAVGLAHPTFNAFDVHGVLRQTSSAWATGWNTTNGYGTVSYSTASGTISSVFLQTPNVQVANHGWYATLTIYPFRTTRRNHEVIYSCTTGATWAVKNEYALSDITGNCGTLLYTSNGTDQTPVYTFVPAASGSVTFVTFTTDGSGAYSRVDPWAPQTQSFTVGSACSR